MAQETPLFAQGFRRAARMGTAALVGRGAQESTGHCSLEALPRSGSPAAMLAEEGPACEASPPRPPPSSPSFQLLLSKGLLPEVFLALLPLPQKTLSRGPETLLLPGPPVLHPPLSTHSVLPVPPLCPSSFYQSFKTHFIFLLQEAFLSAPAHSSSHLLWPRVHTWSLWSSPGSFTAS